MAPKRAVFVVVGFTDFFSYHESALEMGTCFQQLCGGLLFPLILLLAVEKPRLQVSILLPTPKRIIKELNQLLFKFLWKGTDKVTRLSAINEYENGGLKMIDLESMIQTLRLAWIKRIFGANDGTWKSYLRPFYIGLEAFFILL